MKTGPLRMDASVADRLVRHAKANAINHSFVLARYGIERLLWRLMNAAFADQFVVKGATLFLLWQHGLRPTKDLDLLGSGTPDLDRLAGLFRELCGQDTLAVDGLVFHADSIVASRIKPDEDYQGVRVRMLATLVKTKIAIQVDIGFGDAMTPPPKQATFPTILDQPAPKVWVYPAATVIAEKLHAIVELGIRTSRMKDFFDLMVLLESGRVSDAEMEAAILATFNRRGTAIPTEIPVGLSEGFARDPSKVQQWKTFYRRTLGKSDERPLEEVLAMLRERLMPILSRQAD